MLLFQKHSETYALLQQVLKVIHAGVTLGELKGKDIVPDHSLAMTIAMRQGKFLQAELSYEQAIGYLRKEAVVLDSSIPRGYILLTYKKDSVRLCQEYRQPCQQSISARVAYP